MRKGSTGEESPYILNISPIISHNSRVCCEWDNTARNFLLHLPSVPRQRLAAGGREGAVPDPNGVRITGEMFVITVPFAATYTLLRGGGTGGQLGSIDEDRRQQPVPCSQERLAPVCQVSREGAGGTSSRRHLLELEPVRNALT
ncbi:hypothetical protein AAFF_G00019160 [Aldrovandia affinis]|uniref:Uncharacterized protein n=1 Tax=Aldrovandia affinis TaxID=143900 RepID=A0AAD7S5M4_9TELE|nr:hypothetical protein AAFF_G00019160 [Aldrovandia affinis]